MPMSTCQSFRQHFASNNRIKDFSGYGGKIHALGWNCTGAKLGTATSDKSVNIYALDSARLSKLQTFKGHTDSVDQLAWHPTVGETLASVGADGTVRLWDCRSKRSATAQLKGENINVAWAPDGNTIAVGNKNDLLSFLDVRADLKTVQTEQFNCEINEFSWKPSTNLIFLATGNGDILVYGGKPGAMKKEAVLHAHPANAIALQFSPCGSFCAVGSVDALVSLWDADEFVCLRTFARLEWPVRALGFSHDSQLLASSSEDHFIDIGSVETGEQVYRINTTAAATFVLAWHPRLQLLTYSSETKYDRDQGVIRIFGFPSTPSEDRKVGPVAMDHS